MIKGDPISKILYVDLSRKRFWVEERPELFDRYLGGVGVGIKLLLEECPKGADPLGPENPIIFSVGQLNAFFPLASKTVALFKSPHTGNLGESHAGGRSATAIRMAGYGAIVIKGSSSIPVYLVVTSRGVNFRDASALWGMATYTTGRVIREREPGAGVRTIMRIGPAGERLVTYACVVTETYRHFGRLGLGAVFGSKKLKAILIAGKLSFKPENSKLYREVYKEIFDEITKSDLMKKYHELGTAKNILPLNKLGGLPTRNLSSASFDQAENISGESFAEKHLGRRVACSHCPVSCIHLAALREPYEHEPYFYKTRMISYDYEPIYSLGSMLGIGSTEGVLRLMDEAESLGLDVMSTGVALAWATEMLLKGLIGLEETGGLKLKWGNVEAYVKATRFLVEQPTSFYMALARGVAYASNHYGGKSFALTFGGNEMPGYHTGPAAHLGFLTGSRHSHLDGAGYSLDEKMVKNGEKPSPPKIVEELLKEEAWRQILASLVVCFFARAVYKPETVCKTLEVMGYKLTAEELQKLGLEILKHKLEFKFREGFSFKKLSFPKRIFETQTPHGKLSKSFMEEALKLYEKKVKALMEGNL
ncbi:MAG: aldehyde ferredoxin oxidoreductase family protein [Candidatus Hecatellaceae archaeon]|nr:MAG: aldehyde:ferredoxin oxidoreductase [Candidatus Hecatellales archaeon]